MKGKTDMENKFKVVIVKHPNCNTQYTFSVPDNLELKVGDYVLCKVRNNQVPQVGKCITSDFAILGCQLEEMYGIKEENLQPIIGFLKPIMYVFKSNE